MRAHYSIRSWENVLAKGVIIFCFARISSPYLYLYDCHAETNVARSVVAMVTQILSNDLHTAAELLMTALLLRAQYLVWSLQRFPRVAARCLRMLVDENFIPALVDDHVLDEVLAGPTTTTTTASQGPLSSRHRGLAATLLMC